jgi:large conductance mechanosensitive channel
VLAGFRNFISRGNIVELAVAVVIGTAFGAVVTSLVADLLTPIIGAVFGQQDFSGLTFSVNGSEFRYGNFLNAVIAFLTIAAAIYFFVVVPLEKLEERRHGPKQAGTRECPECLSEVPVAARRCAFCTSELPSAVSS